MASFEMLCNSIIEDKDMNESKKRAILAIEICIQAIKNADNESDLSANLGRAQGAIELACILGMIDNDEHRDYWSRANAAANSNPHWK